MNKASYVRTKRKTNHDVKEFLRTAEWLDRKLEITFDDHNLVEGWVRWLIKSFYFARKIGKSTIFEFTDLPAKKKFFRVGTKSPKNFTKFVNDKIWQKLKKTKSDTVWKNSRQSSTKTKFDQDKIWQSWTKFDKNWKKLTRTNLTKLDRVAQNLTKNHRDKIWHSSTKIDKFDKDWHG